jgi:2-polyprenyl-3-methyl-5-hydroxy-6-metoxy-1,4-benzoquinol methylase
LPEVPRSTDAAQWDATRHYQSEDVASNYDASRFSSLAGRVFNTLEQRVVVAAFGSLPKGSRIADAPCGTGRLAEPLLESGYDVHGIDIAAPMLAIAKRRLARFGGRFTAEAVDVRTIDSPTPPFDGVLCARVLMHFVLEDQVEFLRGVVRLTRGLVIINHSLDSRYQRVRRTAKRVLRHQTPARHPVDDPAIQYLLAEAGLRELQRYRLNPLVSEAVYIAAQVQ